MKIKTKILYVFIFFPLFIFSQSSATESFELNLVFDRSFKDFRNIQLFYIGGIPIISCHFKIDSLENDSNYTKVKIYGQYQYFGGANFCDATFILSETKKESVQNYLIHTGLSALKKPNNKVNEQKSDFNFIMLYESQPFIELGNDNDESSFIRNFKFLAELESKTDNKYMFINLFNWTKIFQN